MDFSIRPVVASDWQQYRTLRLEMLADYPIAYAERLETAQACSDDEWRERAAHGFTPTSIRLAAVADTGTWIGSMGSVVFGFDHSRST